MLFLYENSAIEELRKLAVALRGDFCEDRGTAQLSIDNAHGKGYISTFAIQRGLTVNTYNIKFTQEFSFSKDYFSSNPLCILHCTEGHLSHKFHHEKEFKRIDKNTGAIFKPRADHCNEVIIPKNIKVKISVVFISNPKYKNSTFIEDNFLRDTISEIAAFEVGAVSFFRKHFIDTRTRPLLQLLISNTKMDTIGRLMVQSTVLHIIAMEASKLNIEIQPTTTNPIELSARELNQIVKLSAYIEKNISEYICIEKLQMESGMQQKKLQKGFRKLYGQSINEFIRELRLEKARDLIETSDLSISEVSYSVGYSSRSYFSKIFFNRYNISPQGYKTQLRTQNTSVFELSYRSKASDIFMDNDLTELIQKAREKNEILDITGCLIYQDRQFFQIIEGTMSSILSLYSSILKDPRHTQISLIRKGWRKKRSFNNWYMALISDKDGLNSQSTKNLLKIQLAEIYSESEDIQIGSAKYWNRVLNFLKVA